MNIADIAAIVNAGGGGGGTADPWAMFDLVSVWDNDLGENIVLKGNFEETKNKLQAGTPCFGISLGADPDNYSSQALPYYKMQFADDNDDPRILITVYDFEGGSSSVLIWQPDNTIVYGD